MVKKQVIFILRRFIDNGRLAKDPVWHQTFPDQPVAIGRDSANTICISTDFMSKNHGVLSYKKGFIFDSFYYEDVSTSGTYYHPLWLEPGVPHDIDLTKTVLIHKKKVKIEKGSTLIIINPTTKNGVALTVVPNF